jgi:leucyl-tRNA synthetase
MKAHTQANPKYNHKEIESKWRKKWEETKLYNPDLAEAKNPFYNLMMFPYPSAEGLHVGNVYAFSGADVYGRWNRMMGKSVFEPIGLDGFGIHSENYAIKVGRHPREHAKISEGHFYEQLGMIGNGYAWDSRLETYDPKYYRWTQWLFIQMFKAGLAYKGQAAVNWCPTDKTVLSDEQVIDGKCERCQTVVERREMSSWFFRITKYADKLLSNLDKINWPEKIKTAQRNWIGKSGGVEVDFEVKGVDKKITVFTTAHDTIFGTTFMVLAPEYLKKNLLEFLPEGTREAVSKYIETSLSESEQERKTGEKEKTGVDTGLLAVNPLNKEEMPIYVADYVLMDYGTGAVMGVPGHDSRDYEFAKKYNLPIKPVIVPLGSIKSKAGVEKDGFWDYSEIKTKYSEKSELVNSGILDGLTSKRAKESIEKEIEVRRIGKKTNNYHLRDWGISRQRYWGPPIPMIHCQDCGWQPVSEEDLPVLLPEISDFKPKGDGTSPLSNAPESWKKVKCPKCGKMGERELDVSDTFLDSSWYFLAYPNLKTAEWKSHESPFNKEITEKWLPVDAYIGGAEHAVLHLLYSRFVTMVLKDLKYLSFEEPFPFLFGHGLLIKDGAKMSKSKGNVVNPDDYVNKFGADTLRTYLMFLGPFDQGGDFRDTGIEGMSRFINRVWRLYQEDKITTLSKEDSREVQVKMHQTIKKVTEDIQNFRYNTAISAIMEFVNLLYEKGGALQSALEVLAQLLAPFAPYFAEEVWTEVLGQPYSVHISKWPKYDTDLAKEIQNVIVVQINGKLRGQLAGDAGWSKDQTEEAAKKESKVVKWLEGKNIKNVVFVPGKLINFVTDK